jgi:D-alanine-D-alanine ligase
MRVGVLYNILRSSEIKEVEDDLMEMTHGIKESLENQGHRIFLIKGTENFPQNLRNKKIEFVFNVCERFRGSSLFEPHVAGLLEISGIPFTGSGFLTLSLCNNKVRSKEILTAYKIPTPKYQVFCSPKEKLDSSLRFPLIVKPKQQENSIGITKDSIVYDERSLKKRVKYVHSKFNEEVLVEEFIKGSDIEVGIVGNGDDLFFLPTAKVSYKKLSDVKDDKIFCYESKWDPKSENYGDYVKANLPKNTDKRLRKLAKRIYEVFGIRDYGRVDFRLTKNNKPYVIEVTANPGLSRVSSTPEAAEWAGMLYEELINKIFQSALKRYKSGNRYAANK